MHRRKGLTDFVNNRRRHPPRGSHLIGVNQRLLRSAKIDFDLRPRLYLLRQFSGSGNNHGITLFGLGKSQCDDLLSLLPALEPSGNRQLRKCRQDGGGQEAIRASQPSPDALPRAGVASMIGLTLPTPHPHKPALQQVVQDHQC